MTFYRLLLFVLILFPCHQTFASTEGENHLPNDVTQVKFAGLDWSTSYGAAYAEAKASKKMFLILFVPAGENVAVQNLETTISNNRQLQKKLSNFVLASLPIDTEINSGGKTIRLLENPAFQYMQGKPGIAIIDLAHPETSYYGNVTSAFPFTRGKYYAWKSEYLSGILDLPAGSITQRSMIWAVRIHPENPASTSGQLSIFLASAAASHSQHQANLGVQGHHQWGSRVHQIQGQVAAGSASEIVAESWPNQTMIDSCIDCVQSWRHSSGHWGAVRRRHRLFGYDIRRGRNGIWYGTGIFAN